MIAALVAVFVLSGAAGLIYESLWSRYLGLFVGHSAYAQVIVLVIFLGGMSLGAAVAGRRSERTPQPPPVAGGRTGAHRAPLPWYAGVEVLVGVIGLAFDSVFVGVTAFAYDTLFPSLG